MNWLEHWGNSVNKYKTLLKDTFIFSIGNLGSKIILFLLVPLYTNYLTTEEYGIAELVTTFSQLVIPFAGICINDAVIRFALKFDEKKENVLATAFCVFIFSFGFTLTALPLLHIYKPIAPWRYFLAVQIILTTISETEKSYLKAKNQNTLFSIISILQTLVLAVTNIILLTCQHLGIQGYLAANNAALGFTTIVSFLMGRMYRDLRNGKVDWSLLKRMLLYSAPLIFNNISWWAIHSSDKIMIEIMVGAGALGLYTAATKIPSLINVIISIFTQAWGISTIKEVEKDKDKSFFSSVFKIYALLCFGAGIIFTTIIKYFMRIYVGSSFIEAWKYTPLLLSAAVFYAISSYYGSLYAAYQKTVNSMISTVICAIINIVVNFLFIRVVGTWGAIIGTVVSYIVIAHVRMIDMRRIVDIAINYRIYVINCILLLLQAILVSLDWHGLIVSIVTIILFAIVNMREIKILLSVTLRRINIIK